VFKILATHVSIDVPDLQATKQYLEKTLGIKKLRQVDRPDLGQIVWYPGLELWQAGSDGTAGRVRHVAWQVADIDETIDFLKGNGVVFETEEPRQIDTRYLDTKEVIRFIFFKTPDGLEGELYQVDPPGPDEQSG
jgi:catechol 2,3-dioxygenase-like lactoylglutathione lyase family enzyme